MISFRLRGCVRERGGGLTSVQTSTGAMISGRGDLALLVFLETNQFAHDFFPMKRRTCMCPYKNRLNASVHGSIVWL